MPYATKVYETFILIHYKYASHVKVVGLEIEAVLLLHQ